MKDMTIEEFFKRCSNLQTKAGTMRVNLLSLFTNLNLILPKMEVTEVTVSGENFTENWKLEYWRNQYGTLEPKF